MQIKIKVLYLGIILNKHKMKNYKEMTITELAKAICIYNGQRGTEKQILTCKSNFKNDITIMQQFAFNRLK